MKKHRFEGSPMRCTKCALLLRDYRGDNNLCGTTVPASNVGMSALTPGSHPVPDGWLGDATVHPFSQPYIDAEFGTLSDAEKELIRIYRGHKR